MLYLILFLIAPYMLALFSLPNHQAIPSITPKGFENAAVGDILQSRATPKSITGGFTPLKIQNSWQLLVRSEDSFGNPNVIVTTVIEPVNADPSKIASYQVLKMQLKLIVLLPMLFNLVLI